VKQERTSTSSIGAYIPASSSDSTGRDDVGVSATTADLGQLVASARDGDREAFGEIYRRCHASVYRYVRVHLPGSDVEDAVAETFFRAWKGLPGYRERGAPFQAWLVGIARHVVADSYRASKRTQPTADPPDGSVEFQDQETARIALAAAIEQLPSEQRQVIEMKFLIGLTNEEVGRAIGRSAGAVNALQWRALGRLKGLVEPR
jgi:RNA polymerase sigma-70 factor (ECF subfamily)